MQHETHLLVQRCGLATNATCATERYTSVAARTERKKRKSLSSSCLSLRSSSGQCCSSSSCWHSLLRGWSRRFAPLEKGDVRDPWAEVIAGANTPAAQRYRTSILSWVQGLVHVLHPARMRRQIRPCGTHRSTATSRSWPREVLIRPRYVTVETLLRRFELLPVQLGAEQGVGFRGISHRSIVPDATGKFL